jgi:hypothetical protein
MTTKNQPRPKRKFEKICFVICPIGEKDSEVRRRSNVVLKYIIRPAVERCGYTALRADESADPGIITSQIIGYLLEAPLVIADLTDANPNVMYELAVRHTVGKPFLQICQTGTRIPFDIAATRVVTFDPPELENVDETIAEIIRGIKQIEKGETPIQTPIGTAVAIRHLQTSSRSEDRSLADVLAAITLLRTEVDTAQKRSQQLFEDLRSEHDVADSVYQWREGHYQKEKRQLAEQFAKRVLAKRVKYLKERLGRDRIRIIFDSGSTIAPLFDVLGLDAQNNREHWCKDVEIITNNIKGIENILRYRDRPGNRYANLPLSRVSVLPGKVLAAFEAIADLQTLKALESYRDDGIHTIAVTTGNYILLHNGNFLPIARAGYHPYFKATLYDIASEVYVIAPLGKILMWMGEDTSGRAAPLEEVLHRLNSHLKLKVLPLEEDSEEKQYQLVNERLVWSKRDEADESPDLSRWLKKSVLVTTRRADPALFQKHFMQVETQFPPQSRRSEFEVDWELGTGPRLWAPQSPFLALPLTKPEQFEIEVPHENLRNFAEKYFCLPDEPRVYRDMKAREVEADTSEYAIEW